MEMYISEWKWFNSAIAVNGPYIWASVNTTFYTIPKISARFYNKLYDFYKPMVVLMSCTLCTTFYSHKISKCLLPFILCQNLNFSA